MRKGDGLREAVVAALLDGPIVCPKGTASGRLAERLGVDVKNLSSLLWNLDRQHVIVRDVRGKRCYRIDLPSRPLVDVLRPDPPAPPTTSPATLEEWRAQQPPPQTPQPAQAPTEHQWETFHPARNGHAAHSEPAPSPSEAAGPARPASEESGTRSAPTNPRVALPPPPTPPHSGDRRRQAITLLAELLDEVDDHVKLEDQYRIAIDEIAYLRARVRRAEHELDLLRRGALT